MFPSCYNSPNLVKKKPLIILTYLLRNSLFGKNKEVNCSLFFIWLRAVDVHFRLTEI